MNASSSLKTTATSESQTHQMKSQSLTAVELVPISFTSLLEEKLGLK